MSKTQVYIMHSSHLDLYWIGAQEDCLRKGSVIIENALSRAEKEPDFHFLIETARFLEYYAYHNPQRLDALKAAFGRGQFEMAACYTDRLENHVSGEALVRNALYGKKVIRDILGLDCRQACHPDLPGFAEQTPQIYKKTGIDYYLSARGFKNGARFLWQGLDESDIIMYNIPGHYAYYDVQQVISGFEQTKKNIQSDFILLGCSAGDMGPAGTFMAKENGREARYDVADLVKKLDAEYPEYEFHLANAYETLERMDKGSLSRMRGEYPSRWGHHGSAMNVYFYELDKKVDRMLTDAEKLSTICKLLGIPQELKMARHPLRDPGGNGGGRRYFDLNFTPGTTEEWIEYAWRLQITTHDHNFGGVEGAQTEFDRVIYKQAAIKIAGGIIDLCLAALTEKLGAGGDCVAVYNTMNWQRDELLRLPEMGLKQGESYTARDRDGTESLVVYHDGGWWMRARNVPPVGAKTFQVRPSRQTAEPSGAQVYDSEDLLVVRGAYYEAAVSKATGCLVRLTDLDTGKNWAGEGALDIFALRDDSLGGSERCAQKPELDRSSAHVRGVRVETVNPLFAEITVVSEVLDVKLYKHIRLPAHQKRVDVSVSFNWPGTPDVQLKMELLSRLPESRVIYGVPYGAQKYGKYLETESLRFGNDEISYELFNRYREVQGHFAVEQEGQYLMTATSQSALDFIPGGAELLLLRDVRNGAEQDYRFTNFGPRSYELSFTSGEGNWEQAALLPWERQQPMLARAGAGDRTDSLPEESWLSTGGAGVLTVLKLSEQTEGAAVARLYNPTASGSRLQWQLGRGGTEVRGINMDESPCSDDPGRLNGFEIKTVLLIP